MTNIVSLTYPSQRLNGARNMPFNAGFPSWVNEYSKLERDPRPNVIGSLRSRLNG